MSYKMAQYRNIQGDLWRMESEISKYNSNPVSNVVCFYGYTMSKDVNERTDMEQILSDKCRAANDRRKECFGKGCFTGYTKEIGWDLKIKKKIQTINWEQWSGKCFLLDLQKRVIKALNKTAQWDNWNQLLQIQVVLNQQL